MTTQIYNYNLSPYPGTKGYATTYVGVKNIFTVDSTITKLRFKPYVNDAVFSSTVAIIDSSMVVKAIYPITWLSEGNGIFYASGLNIPAKVGYGVVINSGGNNYPALTNSCGNGFASDTDRADTVGKTLAPYTTYAGAIEITADPVSSPVNLFSIMGGVM